jgi:hypothetical protein
VLFCTLGGLLSAAFLVATLVLSEPWAINTAFVLCQAAAAINNPGSYVTVLDLFPEHAGALSPWAVESFRRRSVY